MIEERQYKVQLTDGSITSKTYTTRQEAIRAHRGDMVKLIEVLPKHKKQTSSTPVVSDVRALLISKRSDEDLEISLKCGYSVNYNCPSKDKLHVGLRYLEVSDNNVLEGEIVRLEKYEKSIHHHWKGPGYRPDKEWSWAIYHKNSKIIPRTDAEKKYSNPLKGTQGGISYIKK
jgi:hypothetical protein